jgi:hypothetical protein
LYVFPPPTYIYIYIYMYYTPRPSHPPRVDHPNKIWWSVQVMKLLIMQSSSASGHHECNSFRNVHLRFCSEQTVRHAPNCTICAILCFTSALCMPQCWGESNGKLEKTAKWAASQFELFPTHYLGRSVQGGWYWRRM